MGRVKLNKKQNRNTFRVASLFSGCGGMDIGTHGGFEYLNNTYGRLNTEIIYANDIDERIAHIFNANHKISIDQRDIRTVNIKDIPDHDLLIAGFPCQSFSMIAQNPPRLGYKDARGKLFKEIVRILSAKKPKYFIAENVKGLVAMDKGKVFKLVLKEFEKCGYIVNYKIINSALYGVPQKRERVFIVGIRLDLGIPFTFPLECNDEKGFIGLKEIIEKRVPNKYFFSERAIKGMIRTNKKSKAKMNRGRIQNLNNPSNTVTAHLAKVSLNSTDPVIKTSNKLRRFTPREVARIQGFPDNFILTGTETTQYKALGNAVPPVVMWHIVRQLTILDNNIDKRDTSNFMLPKSEAPYINELVVSL